MKHLMILAICAAPFALAGCEQVGVQSEQTIIGADATPPATVIPGSTRPDGTTVVVQPTRLVSTNLAALAGAYDTDPIACNRPDSPSRVTITDNGLVMGGAEYKLEQLTRSGSALKLDLTRAQGNTVTRQVAYVTPAAQGIVLRASTAGDQNLLRCTK